MPKVWLSSFLVVLSLGCGDDGGGGPPATVPIDSDAGGRFDCIDEDGDGFGRNCGSGRADCDDDDPETTDECRRCVDPDANWRGCPCEDGTMPMYCKLQAEETRQVTRDGVMGSLVCVDGTRYCRDGAWTTCEALWSLAVFVPDS